MKKGIQNVAVSVHNRLLQRAKEEGRAFNELLQLYGLERLLYRISRSEDADRFALKGALMLPLPHCSAIHRRRPSPRSSRPWSRWTSGTPA